VLGTRNRPDVQILKLQRRVEVLEEFVDISGRSRGWTADFVAYLTPWQFPDLPLTRVGSFHDGGYVLPFGLDGLVTGVVSIGVGDNNDVDVRLAEMGLAVHAWDHTVDALPTSHSAIIFNRSGLGDQRVDPLLRSLEEITDDSFGEGSVGLLLLLDAEGAEWGALETCSDDTLARFDVIGIELHDLGDLVLDPSQKLRVLRRLDKSFVPVALHANNHSAVWRLPGLDLPDALEATYVRRSLLTIAGTVGNCPAELMSPCCPDIKEVEIEWFAP
jgi:hypothetical protein